MIKSKRLKKWWLRFKNKEWLVNIKLLVVSQMDPNLMNSIIITNIIVWEKIYLEDF